MSLSIYPHLDFAQLLEGFLYSASSNSDERKNGYPFFNPQPIVVPSRPFADLLQKGIADHLGICMGWEFLTPQEFVYRAVGHGAESPWQKNFLQWRLLTLLEDSSPLAQSGLMEAVSSPRDRFALAGLLADRLDQYGHFRPDWIRAWTENNENTALSDWSKKERAQTAKDAEAWQRGLWKTLAEAIEEKHPAMALSELKKPTNSQARALLKTEFPELVVLCSGSIDPLLVEVLQVMEQAGCSITLHALLPTMAYLGDLRRRQELPDENTDPEAVSSEKGNPLVVSMARNSIGAFLQLGKLDEQYTFWPEVAEAEAQANQKDETLLEHLPRDIRDLQVTQRTPAPSASALAQDHSLAFHECFGPRREVEVLRDEILRALRDFPDLRLEDIHVVTGDPDTYTPLIPAIFEKMAPSLPVRLVEVPSLQEKAAFSGLLAVLEIAQRGRFECSEILELYRLPSLLNALDTEDSTTLERWIKESGLTHGLDEGKVGSFPFACERLLAGTWFSSDSMARYPAEATASPDFILPVADSMRSDFSLRLRFLESLTTLKALFQDWQSQPEVSPSKWAERLQAVSQHFLRLPDEQQLDVTKTLAFLTEQNPAALLDAGAILDWLAEESAARARRTRHAGKIAFGSFRNLQNLPCRVLAMLGMGENFPSKNQVPSWDLLRLAPKI